MRHTLRQLLELEDDLEVVGEAEDGHQAVATAKILRPSLVLMDVSMPLLNGVLATCQILKSVPSTKVLIHSAHSDEVHITAAINSGAMGYLIKHTPADIVCQAIREVHKGNTFFSSTIPKRIHKQTREPALDGSSDFLISSRVECRNRKVT